MREPSASRSETLAGSLLLAHPTLTDPNFRRTVVLISKHDEEGAMGVVLNRPLGKRLGQLTDDFAGSELADVPLFSGGPVEPTQVILCAWRPQPEGEGFQLMFGLDPERALTLAQDKEMHLRAFLGYAGWSAGQLEGELSGDFWVTSDLQPELMEISPDVGLWRAVLGAISDEWRLEAGEPDDPTLN